MRAELAALEAAGCLTHPHTSAGRVPTDAGYRLYVDLMLAAGGPPADAGVALELSRMRREVDEAMRETSAALAQVTDLMAVATAPPLARATHPPGRGSAAPAPGRDGRRDRLQRGGDEARLRPSSAPVDPGLVEWASSYLNERLAGLGVGARMIADRLADPELGGARRLSWARSRPRFRELDERAEADLYVDGPRDCSPRTTLGDLPRVES